MSISNASPSSPPSKDHHMIALYYCYPPSRILQLKPHANFHRKICAELTLGGRIRVAEEGINGVLSGTEENLREYEHQLRKELIHIVSLNNGENLEADSEEWLDIKYCHLREDIPADKQLFHTLSVKITREVVSLIEPVADNNVRNNKGRARCRQRRKQRRKEKQRLDKKLQEIDGENDTNVNEQTAIQESLTKELDSMHIGLKGHEGSSSTCNGTSHELGTALPIQGWEQSTPAVHLSPQEWNEKLLQISREKHDQSGVCTDNDATQEHQVGDGAILLDTRNIYETRVGHFAVPELETFFPNTRKFSSLPNALNTEEAAKALAGKQIFMYCTGGVRCERAGSYLRALSESNAGAWKDVQRPKGIYQLQGGIQKYLKCYGKADNATEKGSGAEDVDSTAENISEKGSGVEDIDATNSPADNKPCLYRGKNFVFDPRRTDPRIGNGITNASSGECMSLVGKCILCSNPHDDYDNGHAPCEEKEARCCRCRVLVLVCNECRGKVRSWGEPESGGQEQDLFCGNLGNECIDEGNIAEKVETARW